MSPHVLGAARTKPHQPSEQATTSDTSILSGIICFSRPVEMTHLIGMSVMELVEYDRSPERRENHIYMGMVARCEQIEDGTYCYVITGEEGNERWGETWSCEEVLNGNQLYESAVNLWTPNCSNYMNERVAITHSWRGEVEVVVFGRVSGQLGDNWSITWDCQRGPTFPWNSDMVRHGVRLFQEIKASTRDEYNAILTIGSGMGATRLQAIGRNPRAPSNRHSPPTRPLVAAASPAFVPTPRLPRRSLVVTDVEEAPTLYRSWPSSETTKVRDSLVMDVEEAPARPIVKQPSTIDHRGFHK
jgi:hypothetical protein